MASNNTSKSENILVKVDQNNLIYVDPNSVLSDGQVAARNVDQEKLVMYVNLEADIVPRSILTATSDTSSLTSIARGKLNFLGNQTDGDNDLTTDWTDAFLSKKQRTKDTVVEGKSVKTNEYFLSDETGQSFGIESISIVVKGANFVPQVNINFIDVRGKTLFETPENSPYRAFFHIPWPIFYLTVKGYYGKAIRFRLHLVKFNTRYNDSNGNFEVATTFVGSTYAFMNDIPLKGVINAPYMFLKTVTEDVEFDEKTGMKVQRASKSSKGYAMLTSVYSEMKRKKLIPENFPIKTLLELQLIAQSLDSILEKEIHSNVVDTSLLAGIKDYEDTLLRFEQAIRAWSNKYLSKEEFEDVGEDENRVRYFSLLTKKTNPINIVGSESNQTLENLINTYTIRLRDSSIFNNELQKNKSVKIDVTFLSKGVGEVIDYYKQNKRGEYVVAVEKLVNEIRESARVFYSQKEKVEQAIQQKMNEIFKSKEYGIGFEPTVRNLFAILLANAEVYVRMMKEVHTNAFNVANERKDIIGNFDEETIGDSIYPWPEIKKSVDGGNQKSIVYPGDPELREKLKSNDALLWPEVSFIEEYVAISTKSHDPLSKREGGLNDVSYIFESDYDESRINEISTFFKSLNIIPYSDRSIVSFLYEIQERIKQSSYVDSFNTNIIKKLSEIEFNTIEEVIKDEYDLIDIIKSSTTSTQKFVEVLESFSPFERRPYLRDSIPTTQYIRDILETPTSLDQYKSEIENRSVNEDLYKDLNAELLNYTPDPYRKNVYPFNSDLYLSYLGKNHFTDDNFKFRGILSVDTRHGFVVSPINKWQYVRGGESTNLFTQKLAVGNNSTNILNTPYFHKQLYNEFFNGKTYGKYVGSAYLLLNSLPFYDLDEYVSLGSTNQIPFSSLFREVSSSHFIPYHLILKWGSIYHRYKTYLIGGGDILSNFLDSGQTTKIDGKTFFDNNQTQINQTTYNVGGVEIKHENNVDVGFHPHYDSIFHQIVNGYNHYDTSLGDVSLASNVSLNAVRYRRRNINDINYWTGFVDNSKFDFNDKILTLLPCDGSNKFAGKKESSSLLNPIMGVDLSSDDFGKVEQFNYRVVWEDEYLTSDFHDRSFFTPTQYNKNINNHYSIEGDIKKVIDLIATFSPQTLDLFEDSFLQFASKKVKEESPYKPFNRVKYDYFQDLLKEIVSVDKGQVDDNLVSHILIEEIKKRQNQKLIQLTDEITSTDNLIKITLSNPKEIDTYVLNGFGEVRPNSFKYGPFHPSQYTNGTIVGGTYEPGTADFLNLYLGEDIDGHYFDFFQINNVELNEENILRFRPLIFIYAGYRKSGGRNIKTQFQEYVRNEIILPSEDRFSLFINLVLIKLRGLESKKHTGSINFIDGYNDKGLKIELYNFFKSFNDKWSAGNSIGQRLLLEEFLFLDKANKDIGSRAFLNIDRFTSLLHPRNSNINLYGAISLLIQNTGFDMRTLPAYVNFYGTNFSSKSKLMPSNKIAENIFGTFLEVDYQESSPKVIIQYTGPSSKHLADMDRDYKFADDSFNIGSPNNNPLIITLPDVFNVEELQKSNKVVAFEVSFGDQYQNIFKGVQLDQSTIRNTSESFVVLENLARNESGTGAHNVDIGLFEYYRQASYSCEVTAMGNMMIQPTMFFYLKNIPMFRGSYWITEVTHNIRSGNITTIFKGSRIPRATLPDPEDSFVSTYKPLFDRLLNRAIAKNNEALSASATEVVTSTDSGPVVTDPGNVRINGETILFDDVGITRFGIPYNGFGGEKYIQKVRYKENIWYRAVVVEMGSSEYEISNDTHMSLITRLRKQIPIVNPPGLSWNELKTLRKTHSFYSSRFQFTPSILPDDIIEGTTTFMNPNKNDLTVVVPPRYDLDRIVNSSSLWVQGPVNIGPNVGGYGVGMSEHLMKRLGIHKNEVVYFKIE